MSSVQSLKSAQNPRVRLDIVDRLYSTRQNLGTGSMCPVGVGDQYFLPDGRPAGKFSSYDFMGKAPECSPYNISAREMLSYETNQRPAMPLSATGIRDADSLGVGRNLLVRDLYADKSGRGQWQNLYPRNAINMPREQRVASEAVANTIPDYNMSMDATSVLYRG